jgi:MFS transporter, DHA1 family, inner membrane transport protein
MTTTEIEPGATSRPQWAAFVAVCAAYLSTTIGEAILAPAFPMAAEELGLDVADAGLLFGLLTASIAAGNIVGGYLLARRGPKPAIVFALVVTGAGALLAAISSSVGPFVAAQAMLGGGSGLFFAPGINTVGKLGGARRGYVMGLFGTAFSLGLAVAAVLAALGARVGWRLPFAVGAVTSLIAIAAVATASLPQRRPGPDGGQRKRLRDAVGVAAGVGSVGAMTQYGTVAFLPAFAVTAWHMHPGTAALVLAGARVLSVPAKMLTGEWADRYGAMGTARRLGLLLAATGAWWTLAPGPWVGAWAAVVFAATVSSIFPVANLLAFEGFGDRGPLLGTFRSVQMAVGAAGSAAIGGASAAIGLRPTLATVAVLVPLALVVLERRSRA